MGSWTRDENWEIDGVEISIVWTATDDTSCRVELTSSEFADAFDCTYTEEAGEFTITDDGCEIFTKSPLGLDKPPYDA